MTSETLSSEKQRLRAQLRQQRRAFSEQQQRTHAEALAVHFATNSIFLQAEHIAFYLANDGELSVEPLLNHALQADKHCYLPKLKGSDMNFCRYDADSALEENRFGIKEPSGELEEIVPQHLDLVLLPLVGFDRTGRRLGMGGGFYDRCFAFKVENATNTPSLIGIAHSAQECRTLPEESWDIPLDGVLTEKSLLEC